MAVAIISLLLTAFHGFAPAKVQLQVDGLERSFLVYDSKISKTDSPLVLVFHGHGGSSEQAARSFRLHDSWPEAVTVYPQGLPTSTGRDPEGKRAGWQLVSGGNGDRDIKFVDAILRWAIEKHRVNPKRVYAAGHSNGGAFVYLLWKARSQAFAALAPSAASSTALISKLPPKPIMVLASESDRIVSYDVQERAIKRVKDICRSPEKGAAWAKECTLYKGGAGGADVVVYLHEQGHRLPGDAGEKIAKFFREH
ncbi:MAG: hypothetical protein AKCLJLPJ_02101 [Fimbriimonadales bacterium]|nr:hypothetical protein [Fimbriimonadales bacterium]